VARTPNDGAIAERARKSLGLLTIQQLDAIGVTRQRRRTLVARGTLVPLGRGVFRHCAWSGSWEQLVLAAVLKAGPGAVASHLAAARLWRFEGISRGQVEVTVPAGRHPVPDHGSIHRSRDLVAADIERRARIPVTTAARTLLDIAPRVEESCLEAVLDHAERRGIVWRPHLRWRLRELARQGRPGVPVVRRLLDRTEGRGLGDSWLEQEGLRLIAHAGLPVPRCQVELRKAGGGIARVDLFWEEARLVVELDGHGTHATRRDRQAAAERAARLGLERWHVVSFTYEDVTERPDYVVAMIRTYLGSVAA
jgi:Protein of unknown function (DUF559)